MTSQSPIYFHDRILDKLILWMIPQWVLPNSITWLRVFLTPFVIYVTYRGWYSIGIPLFIFTAFTDAVDGSLARTRNQITDFGKLFDPFADKFLVGSMVVLLVFKHLNPIIGYIIIGVELIFIIFGLARRSHGRIEQANVWGKIKMFLQVVAVCAILIGLALGSALWLTIATWVFGAAIIFALISLFFHGV